MHQKFVEVDAAVANFSSTLAASSQTSSQPAPRVVPHFVPQTGPSATAQPSESPWDAGASQSRVSDTIPQGRVSNPQSETPRDPSQETERSRRYSLDPKRWTDPKKLGLDMKPEGFVVWHDRALGYLAAERPDIRKLLIWAESQNPTIGATEEEKGAASVGVHGDICHISYVIFEPLKMIMSDSLLSRARACEDGRSLELWRKLHAEWRGSAPQVLSKPRLGNSRIPSDVSQCSNCGRRHRHGNSWCRRS